MATIDSLDIKISASANSANKAIGTLSQNLSTLSHRLGKLNGNSLTNFSSAMKTLSEGMKNLNGITAKDFTPIASGIKKFSDIDTGKISSIGGSLKTLANGLNTISGTSFNAESLNGISSALSKLGSVKGTAGADNLLKIENSLSQFVAGMNRIGSVTFDTTNLSNLINSVSRLGSTRASDTTKNLPTISAQLQNFVRQLNKIGSLTFESTNLSNLIASISKLGNKSAVVAATNLPVLTQELESLMKTLSKAPRVSDNVIDMTNALANLARTGASSGRAANSLSRSLDTYSLSASRAGLSTKSFRVSLTGLVAKISSIVIALKGLKKAIDISSSLTEVQNAVDVTFGNMKQKVEDLASVSIQDFGMSELTAKQIASRFQAMGVAMGFSQTKMSDMSIELTKLAADMSSFYNVAQEDVARSLQSVFTGETEPLRRYGLDLSQVTLQEWALNNGLNANIQAMSQAEKAMLRYQYVMENSQFIIGDFARTSDSWSNTVRTLKQNFEALGAVIGGTLINAFKPFVSALNSVMQSVISFAKIVANALGAIFGWTIEINPGGVASDFEAAGAGAEAMEDGTAGAAKNLKGTNKYIAAWQEVNSLTSSDASGGSGGGAGGGGTGAGTADVAQANLVRVETIFDKYKSEIDNLYDLGKYIGDTLSRAMESINWDSVYEKARNFGTGLAQFLNGLISPRLFGNVGKTIAGALNTALNFLDSFGEEFDWKNLGNSIMTGVVKAFETLDFYLIGDTLSTAVSGILDFITGAISAIEWSEVPDLIAQKLTDFFTGFNWKEVMESLGNLVGESFKAWFELNLAIGEKITEALSGIRDYFLGFVVEELGNLDEDAGILNIGIAVLKGIKRGIINEILKIDEWIRGNIVDPIVNGIGKAFGVDGASSIMKEKGQAIMGLFKGGMASERENIVSELNIIKNNMAIKLDEIRSNTEKTWENIKQDLSAKWEIIKLNAGETWENLKTTVVTKWAEINQDTFEKWENVKSTLITVWEELKSSSSEKFTSIKDSVTGAWNALKQETPGIWESIRDSVKGPINAIIGFLNKLISGVESAINLMADGLNNVDIDIPEWVPGIGGKEFKVDMGKVSLGKIPELAQGGVLKKGQWGFLEGDGAEAVVPLERNTEWINNVAKEISDRIQPYEPADLLINPVDANYHTTPYQPADLSAEIQEQIDVQMATYMFEVRRQNELLEEQNALLERIYDKTGITEGEIFDATRKGVKSFQNRTKKNPWPVLA